MRSRWLTPVGVLVIALVVLAGATGDVGVGTGDAQLAVSLCLAGYALAGLMFLLDTRDVPARTGTLLLVLGAASVALHTLDPNGPVVGLFLVPAFAPLRLPVRPAALVAAGCTLAFNVTQLLNNTDPVVFALVTDGGAAFFFLFGWLLRREGEQRVHLDIALRELAASRDAETVAAALTERSRIAREMHDVLAHTLSGLSLQLGGVRLLADAGGASQELRDGIERAHLLAKEGLAEARRAIGTLRGDALPGPEQLPALIDAHRTAGGQVELTVVGEPKQLGPEQRLALYRAAQEGLSNIRKHAPGTSARLSLTWTEHAVTVEVRNALPGGTLAQGSSGYGLTGLAERAELLGGRVVSGPVGGHFRLHLELPASEAAR